MSELDIIFRSAIRAGYDINDKRRKREIVYARYAYFHFCRILTEHSLLAIGKKCGRDHTTVINGLRQVEKLRNYEDFNVIFEAIKKQIPATFSVNPMDRELKYLYSNKARLEKEIEILKAKLTEKKRIPKRKKYEYANSK